MKQTVQAHSQRLYINQTILCKFKSDIPAVNFAIMNEHRVCIQI